MVNSPANTYHARDLDKEPYCECCDLRISSCGKRKAQEQAIEMREYRKQLAEEGWFRAHWPGNCTRCGRWFDAQTMIKSEGFRSSRYIGECCAPF